MWKQFVAWFWATVIDPEPWNDESHSETRYEEIV